MIVDIAELTAFTNRPNDRRQGGGAILMACRGCTLGPARFRGIHAAMMKGKDEEEMEMTGRMMGFAVPGFRRDATRPGRDAMER